MYEFLSTLAKTLQRCGLADVKQNHSYLMISGVEYYFTMRSSGSVTVEGKLFRSPIKNIDKVTLHIIQSLPEKIERKRKSEIARERERIVDGINRSVSGTNLAAHSYYSEEKYTLTATYEDKESLMAAMDWLQEGGFCFNKDEAVFRQRWAQSAMDNLTGEEVEEFLLRTIKSLPKDKMKLILNALLSETE